MGSQGVWCEDRGGMGGWGCKPRGLLRSPWLRFSWTQTTLNCTHHCPFFWIDNSVIGCVATAFPRTLARNENAFVMRLPGARQHDDQLVRSGAIRCQPRHRVLGALELVAVADEDQTIRRLVWGREGRKGRSKGNEEEQSHFVQRLSSHTSLLQDAAGLLSPERELPCKSIAVHRLSRSQYTSTQSAGVSTRRAVA